MMSAVCLPIDPIPRRSESLISTYRPYCSLVVHWWLFTSISNSDVVVFSLDSPINRSLSCGRRLERDLQTLIRRRLLLNYFRRKAVWTKTIYISQIDAHVLDRVSGRGGTEGRWYKLSNRPTKAIDWPLNGRTLTLKLYSSRIVYRNVRFSMNDCVRYIYGRPHGCKLNWSNIPIFSALINVYDEKPTLLA